MPDGRLYIGNRRYSSWSMRGWLAVRLAELDVEEVMIHFVRPGTTEAIGKLSPNGLVPYLEHHGARVWELIAVCEYLRRDRPVVMAGGRDSASACARDQRRNARRVFRIARVDVDESGAGFFGLGTDTGGACRHRAHRGDVGGHV